MELVASEEWKLVMQGWK